MQEKLKIKVKDTPHFLFHPSIYPAIVKDTLIIVSWILCYTIVTSLNLYPWNRE